MIGESTVTWRLWQICNFLLDSRPRHLVLLLLCSIQVCCLRTFFVASNSQWLGFWKVKRPRRACHEAFQGILASRVVKRGVGLWDRPYTTRTFFGILTHFPFVDNLLNKAGLRLKTVIWSHHPSSAANVVYCCPFLRHADLSYMFCRYSNAARCHPFLPATVPFCHEDIGEILSTLQKMRKWLLYARSGTRVGESKDMNLIHHRPPPQNFTVTLSFVPLAHYRNVSKKIGKFIGKSFKGIKITIRAYL